MTAATHPNATGGAVFLSTSQPLLDRLENLGFTITTRLLRPLPCTQAPLIPTGSGLLLLPAGADKPHLILIRASDTDAPEQPSEFYSQVPVLTLPEDTDRLKAVLHGQPEQAN